MAAIITPDKKIVTPKKNEPTMVKYLTPEELPFKPLLWYLVIEPRPAPEKVGSLYTAQDTQEVEETQTTLGRIVFRGALVGEGRTASGLRLNDDPAFAALVTGDDVLFAKYTGQRFKFRDPAGFERKVIILSDTDLIAAVENGKGYLIRYWL